MMILFFRTIILYVTIVAAMRIMGKRQIGQLEPIELVVAIIISDLASVPIETVEIPLLNGLIPIVTLMLCEIFFSFLTLKNGRLRRLMIGTPSILIHKGQIDEAQMRRQRINMDDLLEELRKAGYPDIRSVHTAVLENNGTINVIPMAHARPVTVQDMHFTVKQDVLPVVFVSDGNVMKEDLLAAGKNIEWLNKTLKEQGIETTRSCLLAQYDGQTLYVQRRKGT